MKDYNKFQYIYPPRPDNKIPPSELQNFDNGEYIGQPKYNGTCCLVFTNGRDQFIYNRHKELLSNYSRDIDFKSLAKSNSWYVYVGEYLNKGKLGESGNKLKDMFVIWDVLVWSGEYLIGEKLISRLRLLENIYPCERAVVSHNGLEMYEHICCTEFKGIYKTPTYMNDFKILYDDLVKTDIYEGLVLKKIESKLTYGFQELNNHDWQIKCRKETKIYHF